MSNTLKTILKTIIATLIFAYVFVMLVSVADGNDEIVCNRLEITMADSATVQLISSVDIAHKLQALNLNPVGKTYKHIETESIENTLRQNPMIKKAECFKTPSGVVRVRIVQREPKFRVITSGESYYVDKEKKTMPTSPNYAAYVPVVSGAVTRTQAVGELFDFITFLEKKPFWNAQIEQIYVTSNKEIELVPRIGEGIILLGSLENYEQKLGKLYKLYTKAFNEIGGWNSYKTIDLRYKDQVVCTRRQL